jgi:hypothetical protein
MLFTLKFLSPVFNQDGGLKAQLQKNMETVNKSINDFGNVHFP